MHLSNATSTKSGAKVWPRKDGALKCAKYHQNTNLIATIKTARLFAGLLVAGSLVCLLVGAKTQAIQVKQQPQPLPPSSSVSSSSSAASSSSSSSASAASPASGPPQQQQRADDPQSQSASQAAASRSSSLYAPDGSQSAPASNYNANSQPQQYAKSNSYLDQMVAAASNPETSYQAAAQSVNMALANSGIYSSNGQQQQQPQQQSAGSQQQLNPLHYFYYPAKENSGASQQQSQKMDPMMAAASNGQQSQYQPNYADQMGGPNGASGPSSASAYQPSGSPSGILPADQNQDSNYNMPPTQGVAGPQMYDQAQSMYSNGGQNQNQNQNQPSDLMGYASNQMSQMAAHQQPQASSISFSGPASSGQSADFMHHHHQQQQQAQQVPQQQQQQSGQNIHPNGQQYGDLSTSNYGNSPAGLSSIASYLSPSGQQPQQQPSDLFAGSLFSSQPSQQQPFASAASQISQASAAAPGVGPQQQQQSGYGPSSAVPTNQQQNSLFASPHYLNSFLSPQQYSQLAAAAGNPADQQLLSAASQLAGLMPAGASPYAGQGAGPALNTASSSPSASTASAVGSSSSSKRFGISSFIMPMLALAGLSLLIPTMSNIGTAVAGKRKKRSIGADTSIDTDKVSLASRQQQIQFDSILNGPNQLIKELSIGEYMDKIERYYNLYKNAVENESCLNRLICEFGDAVKDMSGKSAVVGVIEHVAPKWMEGKLHVFREAAESTNSKEKCKKFTCHGQSRQQH